MKADRILRALALCTRDLCAVPPERLAATDVVKLTMILTALFDHAKRAERALERPKTAEIVHLADHRPLRNVRTNAATPDKEPG